MKKSFYFKMLLGCILMLTTSSLCGYSTYKNDPNIYSFCTTKNTFVKDSCTYALRHHNSNMYFTLFALKPEKAKSIIEIPQLILYETEDGGFIVYIVDKNGNILYQESGVVGPQYDIILRINNQLLGIGRADCTHVPCNNEKVWGAINHITSGSTCTKVRYQFYKCACCGQLLGFVDGSVGIVGTHPASDHN